MIERRLPEYLAASTAEWPHRPAVIDTTGVVSTFADLDRESSALAGYLRDCGVTRGDRVAIVLPKMTAAIVAMFGVMKAGAAYVPIDVTAPAERSRRILDDCAVRAVIASAAARDALSLGGHGHAQPHVIVVDGDGWSQALNHPPDGASDAEIDDLAYIIYTSGSTGMPKGVMITHRNASSYVEWSSTWLQPTPEDRFSNLPPFHFDASVQDIYPAIKHGAAVCLISEDVAKRPRELAAFLEDRRVTVWNSPPSPLTLLVQFGNLEAHACHLRLVATGGEVFPIKHLRALKKLWPSPTFYNEYGPTEASTACVLAKIPCTIPDDRETPYAIGFPGEHCNALVLDDDENPVAPGHEGVLHLSGPPVFVGYWNRPEETQAAFRIRDGVKWYITGDVVRWDPADGYTFIGRKDGMVKRRGFRIELGEIERALYLHPQVREAGVVALPNPDGVQIVAVIVCHGERPTLVELKSFCASKIPAYMAPDRFAFRDQLPTTSTGKTDYQTLRRELHA